MVSFAMFVVFFLILNLIAARLERQAWRKYWWQLRLPRLLAIMEAWRAATVVLGVTMKEAAEAMRGVGKAAEEHLGE